MDIQELNSAIRNHVEGLESAVKKLKGGNLPEFENRFREFMESAIDFEIWIYRNRKLFQKDKKSL